MTPETRRVAVEGRELCYRDWPGEKGPIVCLHSLTGHKGSFDSLAGRLSPEYRLLAMDFRGRGDSSKPPLPYGFAYHARDIIGLTQSIGVQDFILIGHSFGATTGVYLASIRPNHVRAAVLLDGGADPHEGTMRSFQSSIDRLDKTYANFGEYLQAVKSSGLYTPWTESIVDYLRAGVNTLADGGVRPKADRQAITEDLRAHFDYSMCLHFPNLRCPVLFVRPTEGLLGEKGHVYTPAEAENIAAEIPDCRRIDVEGVNHYTLLIHDDPPVLGPIRDFLEEVEREYGERSAQ